MDQIVLSHVTKTFTTKTLGTVTAVNDFNLTIKEGECFSFLGPSGCGKTTVTCAVLQALVARGLRVGAAKCGPDYIDPMFHSRVIGAKSSNLDSFFFDRDTMRYLLAHNGEECDVTVIEGVMGYYDGLGLTSTRASTYETARETESPVVLVVNARGAALSVVAAVQGFLDFAPDNNVQGVILNGCSAMSYGALARELESRLGVRACGYLPRLPECALESRHLGLVTADEVADLREKLRKLAAVADASAVNVARGKEAAADFHEAENVAAAEDRPQCASAGLHAAGIAGKGRAGADRRGAGQGVLLLL